MAKVRRWSFSAPCIRPVGEDGVCPGRVHCHGYDDPGGGFDPPEGERLADECDTCGYDDWTEKEKDAIYNDDGPYADDGENGGDGPDD